MTERELGERFAMPAVLVMLYVGSAAVSAIAVVLVFLSSTWQGRFGSNGSQETAKSIAARRPADRPTLQHGPSRDRWCASLAEEGSMDKSVMEVFMVGGVAISVLALGFAWLHKLKLSFMAWPVFGVAGAVTGILLQRPEVMQWSFGLAAFAMAAQIVYAGWKLVQGLRASATDKRDVVWLFDCAYTLWRRTGMSLRMSLSWAGTLKGQFGDRWTGRQAAEHQLCRWQD